jgi:tetratricopeptide (TPR) repeat protein
VRHWFDRARIHATLARIDTQPLVLHPEVDLSPLKLTHDEEGVLAVIRAESPTLRELLQRRVAEEEHIGTLVYTLAVTRQFAFPGSKGLPLARKHHGAKAAAAPIADRVSALPFSAVVEPRRPDAPPDSKGAVPASAPSPSTWRPPQAASPAKAPEVPIEVVLDAAVDEGWSDETPAAPPPPAAVREDVSGAEKAIQAMTDFRLAETALQRGDPKTAERLAARAVEGDPSQTDYPALLAWVRAMSGAPAAVNDAIGALTQLLARDARSERALHYRGQLLKRAGRARDALRDFERILETNPHHREAASEVRVLRQRIGK